MNEKIYDGFLQWFIFPAPISWLARALLASSPHSHTHSPDRDTHGTGAVSWTKYCIL